MSLPSRMQVLRSRRRRLLLEGGIEVVGSDSVDAGASATQVTLIEPAGAQEGDLVIAIFQNDAQGSTLTEPADFTAIDELDVHINQRYGLYYKVRGAGQGNGYTFSHSFSAGTNTSGAMIVLRGVDQSTPLDVAYAVGTHHISSVDDLSYAPQDITTASDGALIVILSGYSGGPGTVSWQGITNYTTHEQLEGGSGRNLNILTRTKDVAGLEDPGAFGTTGDAGEDGASFTLAIRRE